VLESRLDLRQLRYFVAVVEAGSFSRAAEQVHVAQSALSARIRKMEESLGAELLVRMAKGVRPTPAGEKLLDHARAILHHVSQAEAELKKEGARPKRLVSIGMPAGAGRVLTIPLLDAVKRNLPQITLQIVELTSRDVCERLEDGRVDLAVNYTLTRPAFGQTLLAEEELYLVSGAAEVYSEGVMHRDLASLPLVMPASGNNCVAREMETRGTMLRIESRIDSLATIIDLVAQGRRSILAPSAFLREWLDGKLLAYPLSPPMFRSVVIESSRDSAADAAVTAVDAVVRETVAGLIAGGGWPTRLAAPGGLARAETRLAPSSRA
jgi:LysR family nitrogen assimilation transcriptional regulator